MNVQTPASISFSPCASQDRGGALRWNVHSDFASLDGLREAWDALAIKLKASVHMSYDWQRVWWEFYQGARQLRVFTFFSDDDLVGIVPTYLDTFGAGPLRFRVARLVGASIPPHLLQPPVRETFMPAVCETVFRHLFEVEDCDCISIGPVSDQWSGRHELLAGGPRLPELVGRTETIAVDVHAVFSLPDTFEKYLDSLSKSERKRRRNYDLRLLRKEFETTVEVVSAPERVADEFERFMAEHASQWRAEAGHAGHFKSYPRAEDFNRTVVKTQGGLGRMRFIRLVANGQVIANQYVFAFGDAYYGELLARVTGREWDRFSLGRTAVAIAIQKAIEEGMSRLEGGIGGYDFKSQLGAQKFGVSCLRFVRRNPSSLRKAQIYASCLRPLVALAYDKIWYRRILRKLPARWQRPRSFYWLRWDF